MPDVSQEFMRFIPTRVGNGDLLALLAPPKTVHPHSRGERVVPRLISRYQTGSSPLAWGTVALIDLIKADKRFIPTRVGNGQQQTLTM